MNEVKIIAETPINPTEDPEKVRTAVENILPNAQYELKPRNHGQTLIAKAWGREALIKLKTLFRTERIRTAAKAQLMRGIEGKTLTFYLNKQAAYMNRISFSQPTAESPLGPIKLKILCDNPEALVNWLTAEI
ncbi:MAG TPA: hypothetical protein ENG27_01435 [Candidatus Bathyarchaeota archaeon]|nr:hypothetical protein [Candidatus Bathyarchaeota archaeon]